jgi:hypothetical protein
MVQLVLAVVMGAALIVAGLSVTGKIGFSGSSDPRVYHMDSGTNITEQGLRGEIDANPVVLCAQFKQADVLVNYPDDVLAAAIIKDECAKVVGRR